MLLADMLMPYLSLCLLNNLQNCYFRVRYLKPTGPQTLHVCVAGSASCALSAASYFESVGAEGGIEHRCTAMGVEAAADGAGAEAQHNKCGQM